MSLKKFPVLVVVYKTPNRCFSNVKIQWIGQLLHNEEATILLLVIKWFTYNYLRFSLELRENPDSVRQLSMSEFLPGWFVWVQGDGALTPVMFN